jgi:hypothetical protein
VRRRPRHPCPPVPYRSWPPPPSVRRRTLTSE